MVSRSLERFPVCLQSASLVSINYYEFLHNGTRFTDASITLFHINYFNTNVRESSKILRFVIYIVGQFRIASPYLVLQPLCTDTGSALLPVCSRPLVDPLEVCCVCQHTAPAGSSALHLFYQHNRGLSHGIICSINMVEEYSICRLASQTSRSSVSWDHMFH